MERPLVCIATGFACGLILANYGGIWSFLLLAPLLLLSVIYGRAPWSRSLLPFLLTALCGVLYLVWRTPVWPGVYGSKYTEGRISTVVPAANGWQLTVQLRRLDELELPCWNPVKAQLFVSTSELSFSPGDLIQGSVKWQAIRETQNPGEFSYAAYLRHQGVLATAFTKQGQLSVVEGSGSRLFAWRQHLLGRIALLPGEAGELWGTLTLGTRTGPWAADWRRTGLAHILSISGFHIGLVSLALLGLLRVCRLPETLSSLTTGVLLLVYGLVLGPRAAVWRAIIMAWLGLLAVATRRLRDWPTALSLAALLLLIYNPYFLWGAGWQLSFAASFGILCFAPRLKQHLPLLPLKLDEMLAVGLAAQLATLPFVLYHFYLLSPFSLLFNLLLTPLLPLLLIMGLFCLLVPFAGTLLLPVLDKLYTSVLNLVSWFARWPLAGFSPGFPPLLLLALYVLLLVLLFFHSRFRPYYAASLVMVCSLLLAWQPLTRWLRNENNFTVLSVGQGSAACLHLPGGDALLFDVGGGSRSVGQQIIVPYLQYRGTWRIKAIFLSHLHEDHILGLADVLTAFPVDCLYLPATCLETPAYADLRELLQAFSLKICPWVLGDRGVFGNALVEALNPPPGLHQDENEDSLVLSIAYPGVRGLVPGDIGAREQELLPYLASAIDFLLVPHHGSANSSNEDFLRVLAPDHAIISSGPNLYGHPAPAVLERLQCYAGATWRTDEQGAVSIRSNGRVYHLSTFRR